MNSSHESVVYAKALFADRYHSQLKDDFAGVFTPSEDYTETFKRMYARSF